MTRLSLPYRLQMQLRKLNSNALFTASLVPIFSALGALAGDAIQNNSL